MAVIYSTSNRAFLNTNLSDCFNIYTVENWQQVFKAEIHFCNCFPRRIDISTLSNIFALLIHG